MHPKTQKTALGSQRFLTWTACADVGRRGRRGRAPPGYTAGRHRAGRRRRPAARARPARPTSAWPSATRTAACRRPPGPLRRRRLPAPARAIGSLNVATAASIAIYEVRRREPGPGPEAGPAPDRQDRPAGRSAATAVERVDGDAQRGPGAGAWRPGRRAGRCGRRPAAATGRRSDRAPRRPSGRPSRSTNAGRGGAATTAASAPQRRVAQQLAVEPARRPPPGPGSPSRAACTTSWCGQPGLHAAAARPRDARRPGAAARTSSARASSAARYRGASSSWSKSRKATTSADVDPVQHRLGADVDAGRRGRPSVGRWRR